MYFTSRNAARIFAASVSKRVVDAKNFPSKNGSRWLVK